MEKENNTSMNVEEVKASATSSTLSAKEQKLVKSVIDTLKPEVQSYVANKNTEMMEEIKSLFTDFKVTIGKEIATIKPTAGTNPLNASPNDMQEWVKEMQKSFPELGSVDFGDMKNVDMTKFVDMARGAYDPQTGNVQNPMMAIQMLAMMLQSLQPYLVPQQGTNQMLTEIFFRRGIASLFQERQTTKLFMRDLLSKNRISESEYKQYILDDTMLWSPVESSIRATPKPEEGEHKQ